MLNHYQYLKIDHDSDCAVHNEPYMPNGNCNCGLINPCVDGIRDYLKVSGPFIHEGERDGIVSAFQSGYNFKTVGNDIQFLLDEFKSIESGWFDKEANAYSIKSGTRKGPEDLELMHHLIYKLEEIINQKDNTDWAF